MPQPSKWSLIGIPDHQGVIHVGGRLGAARGPRIFRRVFARLKGRDGVHERCIDRGDSAPGGVKQEDTYLRAAKLVEKAQSEDHLTVVVGGGHDHGYSQLLGLSRKAKRLGCINLDAHLDVRKPDPHITSGSPFYLAIEAGVLDPKRFIEFGIQRHCNAPALWEYVEKKKVQVVPYEKLRAGRAVAEFKRALTKLARDCDVIAISFDLDSAAAAHAPGVSAPQSEGFDPSEVIAMLEHAGSHPKVASLGIFELCPEHDIDDRTARLAATAAYHFVAAALSR